MKHSIIFITLLICLFLAPACDDDLLQETPPNLLSSELLFTDYNGFEAGLNGLYSLVRQEKEGLNGGSELVTDMAMNGTDVLVTNHIVAGFPTIAAGWKNNLTPSNTFLTNVFLWLYEIINTSNTIINLAETNPDIDWSGGKGSEAENQNRIIAEAKAIRAWAYRHLTYGWGDVPLNLEQSKGSTIKTDWTRTPVAEVRKQIITDLLFAEKHVPTEASLPGRITKGAVQHYLGEMYLAVNKPDSALYWTNQVINNPAYQLITKRYGVKANEPGVPFMDMFYDGNSNREEGNTEALWVFQFQENTIGGGENGIMRRHHHSRYVNIRIGSVSPLQVTVNRGGQGFGRASLTKWAIDNYESQDDRSSNYAIRKFFILQDATTNAPSAADRLPSGYSYGDTIHLDWSKDITTASNSRVNWPFSRKWDWAPAGNVSSSPAFNDQIYLRLAETYLLKAEAQFRLGQLDAAAETINVIRSRANASAIAAKDVNIDFILDERARELVTEEHRRYTLLRTGKWLERTKKYNFRGGELIVERDTLLPIPQSVIDANLTQKMPQNPGF